MRKPAPKTNTNGKNKLSALSIILLAIFACIFCVSAFMLIQYFVKSTSENLAFQKLQETMHEPAPTTSISAEAARMQNLESLYKSNNDLAGWLEIEDTKIQYPVMFTPKAPEYYLRRNFSREYSLNGVPFIGPGNTMESDNLIIYGHNMQDGSMFADLMQYESESFFKEHDTLHFDTLAGAQEYDIIAVFKTEISEQHFPYYKYTDFADQKAFDRFIREAKQLSLYDTGRTAAYGDKLVSLSTCSYHAEEGRLVVVAKAIS